MLSYRHLFHAGNFADVFKHCVLIQLVEGLARKDKPFCVLDTHAGAGRYALDAAWAQKTGEFREGIARLWGREGSAPEIEAYLAAVRAHNPDGALARYPGSPLLVRGLLRDTDRLLLCELHPADHPQLKALFAGDRRVAVHHRDGFEAIKALLPPPQRRGLLFIDPSFEQKHEFKRLLDTVCEVHKRWREGMIAVWYPILDRAPSERFCQQLAATGIPAILRAELGVAPYDSPVGMGGSGLVIVNPPWQLDRTLARILPELLATLRRDGHAGETRVEWLSPG